MEIPLELLRVDVGIDTGHIRSLQNGLEEGSDEVQTSLARPAAECDCVEQELGTSQYAHSVCAFAPLPQWELKENVVLSACGASNENPADRVPGTGEPIPQWMAVVTARVLRLDTPLRVRHLVAKDEWYAQRQVTNLNLSDLTRHLIQLFVRKESWPLM